MSMWAEHDLTERQRELVGIVNEIGPAFRDRAEENDREAKFPHQNYREMRDAGLLALCIPSQYGGLGADYESYFYAASELGRYDAATALTFNMHSCSMLWSGPLADDIPMTDDQRREHEANRAAMYDLVLNHEAIFAQPFSEPNTQAASGKAPFGTTARRVGGGYRVTGKKHFASLAGAATHYAVLCTEETSEGGELDARDTIMLAVPGNAEGFEVVGDWDTLGMRPTVSKSLDINDVFVPDAHQIMPRGVYFQAATNWPHMFLTLSPSYMGLAQAAYDFTVAFLRGEVPGAKGSKRASPMKQYAVAEMRIKLEQARALFVQSAREARYEPSKGARLRAYVAGYTIMEHANDVCRLAIRTCGGSSIMKKFPLERFYRDSRCGSLMLPWSAEACLERLGRESLYEKGERD
ncbi:MAG: acyl-CoA dehydrogenase family protein [Minwuia sp.]|uniref:acyl-CoA dehydrogenase family protein n=1 Tax=Minwuia sp. TaxID=2493630 RepID=UPI003A87916B